MAEKRKLKIKIPDIKISRSFAWTTIALVMALLTVIFNLVKLVRVYSLKLLRGIPKEWTFELNTLLSVSFFFHLVGFVYAIGLPDRDLKKNGDKMSKILIYSLVTGVFILLVLIFHIVSTIFLINYSPPNYLLI